MIGLDTSAIIDLAKGDNNVKRILEENKEGTASTMFSYLEICLGRDAKKPFNERREAYYDEFFENILTFNLSKEACKKTAEVYLELKKDGKLIEKFDCIIAGIFLTNGIKKILTKNEEHFKRIKGVEVISY